MDRRPVLETDRLVLRPLLESDWAELFAIASDPAIWAVHPSHDRWREPVFRAFFDEGMERGGALAVTLKDGGAIIGSSQFDRPELEAPGEIEIGWSFLAKPFWGKGYNGEFKRAMIAQALTHYERVIFQVGADNVVSRKAMANIGGVLTDRTRSYERAGVMVEHVIYEITRESFAGGPLSAA
jgi:RimJ/RimL family protein N-acetyltransferase